LLFTVAFASGLEGNEGIACYSAVLVSRKGQAETYGRNRK